MELRTQNKLGPARIELLLEMPTSTVWRVLRRHGLNRWRWMDRPTGRVIRRYSKSRPGELLHVDFKKLGRIPDGGGWKAWGRAAGKRNSQAYVHRRRSRRIHTLGYIHAAVDHRHHTAIGGAPMSRATNVPKQHIWGSSMLPPSRARSPERVRHVIVEDWSVLGCSCRG